MEKWKKQLAFILSFVMIFSNYSVLFANENEHTENHYMPHESVEHEYVFADVDNIQIIDPDLLIIDPERASAIQERVNRQSLENNILTATMGIPAGVVGFEGDYTINDPNEIVEIVVQFATPPSVSLRLMQERGIPLARNLPGASHETQALSAHDAFMQQLGTIPMPLSQGQVEVYSSNHKLFNGVSMRAPGSMLEQIAALPEVFAVFPSITFHTTKCRNSRHSGFRL